MSDSNLKSITTERELEFAAISIWNEKLNFGFSFQVATCRRVRR